MSSLKIYAAKVIIQSFLNTLASMIILGWLHWRLLAVLLPQDAGHWLVMLGDVLAQVLIFAILVLPLAWLAYLMLRFLHYLNKIKFSWATHAITAAIVIIGLLTILRIPQVSGLYVIYIFYSLQIIAQKFYYLAIIYFIVQLFVRVKNKHNF